MPPVLLASKIKLVAADRRIIGSVIDGPTAGREGGVKKEETVAYNVSAA